MKSKLRPEVKERWLAALRSGEYEQGREHLGYRSPDAGTDRFCCLGVLCELAAQAGVVVRDEAGNYVYDGHEDMPPQAVRQWAFDFDRGYEPSDLWDVPIGLNGDEGMTCLAALNDEMGLGFGAIADRIEVAL